MAQSLTYERLLELLHYNPRTGLFKWRVHRYRWPVGSVAGGFNSKGYIYITLDGYRYPASRLAWFYRTKIYSTKQIDHKNRKRSDNRFVNLRPATNGQNRCNSACIAKSGLKGVYKVRYGWQAIIKSNRIRHYLGMFKTKEAAHHAYSVAAKKFHGEFARLK